MFIYMKTAKYHGLFHVDDVLNGNHSGIEIGC